MQPHVSQEDVSGGGLKEFFLGIFAIFAPPSADVPRSIVGGPGAIAPPPGAYVPRTYVPGMELSTYENPTVSLYTRFPDRSGKPFPRETKGNWPAFMQEFEYETSNLNDWKFRYNVLTERSDIIYKALYDVSRDSTTPNPTFREVNTNQLSVRSTNRGIFVSWFNFSPTMYALNMIGRCVVMPMPWSEFQVKFRRSLGEVGEFYDVPLQFVKEDGINYPIVYLAEHEMTEGRTGTIFLPANVYTPVSVVKQLLDVKRPT